MQLRLGWRTFLVPAGVDGGRFRFAVWGALLVALLGASVSCSQPGTVDRVTVVNETRYDLEVDVTDATRGRWLLLGPAEHEAATTSEEVTDMGSTWIFRFQYGGRVVGEISVKREDLSRNNWRVEVPSSVADRMRKLGFEPPPGD